MRGMARDTGMSDSERVGFPPSYREGREAHIYDDIASKLTNLHRENQLFMEIGSGYSRLTEHFMARLKEKGTRMVFSDSAEMLALFPEDPAVSLVPGRFPANWPQFAPWEGCADAVLCYSVLQMVAEAGGVAEFVDHLGLLLAAGGQLLIGDIPNVSKRARYFASEAGRRYHREYVARHGLESSADEVPAEFLNPPPGSLDDSFILPLVARFRSRGFDAYILPQSPHLPFFNRREDLLVVKP